MSSAPDLLAQHAALSELKTAYELKRFSHCPADWGDGFTFGDTPPVPRSRFARVGEPYRSRCTFTESSVDYTWCYAMNPLHVMHQVQLAEFYRLDREGFVTGTAQDERLFNVFRDYKITKPNYQRYAVGVNAEDLVEIVAAAAKIPGGPTTPPPWMDQHTWSRHAVSLGFSYNIKRGHLDIVLAADSWRPASLTSLPCLVEQPPQRQPRPLFIDVRLLHAALEGAKGSVRLGLSAPPAKGAPHRSVLIVRNDGEVHHVMPRAA